MRTPFICNKLPLNWIAVEIWPTILKKEKVAEKRKKCAGKGKKGRKREKGLKKTPAEKKINIKVFTGYDLAPPDVQVCSSPTSQHFARDATSEDREGSCD